MPRLDDPDYKLRKPKKFVRKSLRPWDSIDELRPSQKDEKISNQKVIKNESISKQLVNKLVTEDQTENKSNSQLVNKKEAISKPISKQIKETKSNQLVSQLVNKNPAENTIIAEVKRLSGQQLKLFLYIVENCASRGLLYTTPVTNQNLTLLLNTDSNTVKTTTQRLINKNLIRRDSGKRGRGGFCVFHITEIARNAALEVKRQLQISNQLVSQLVNRYSNQIVNNKEANWLTISTSSSSNNINNKTTTSEELKVDSEWELLDIEPLATIGFSKSHLTQIADQNRLEPAIVQESIHAFAFDLNENNKGKSLKSSPLNYFMGILRNGVPYAPPSNYESEESRAMRIYLERKQENEKKRNEMEEKLLDSEFIDWRKSLTDDQVESLLPNEVRNQNLAAPKTAFLRTHFKNEIWPVKRREIISFSD